MTLDLRKSAFFLGDIELAFRWYEREAGWEVALRYMAAINLTLQKLANQPDLGRMRHFQHAELQGIRSCQVERPFRRHLIFYRYDVTVLDVVRVMHGARDLPRRLLQSPGAS